MRGFCVKKLIIKLISGAIIVCSGIFGLAQTPDQTNQVPQAAQTAQDTQVTVSTPKASQPKQCDGQKITSDCLGDDGILYAKYIYHAAVPEQTETINHPAEPAITHSEHHEAVYEYETVNAGCIIANMGKYAGSCALSQCSDGAYSGASGQGSCSHHGGVVRSDGPWYIYEERPVLVTPAWDEEIVDVPAKEAWTETIIIAPAVEAYIEKLPAR